MTPERWAAAQQLFESALACSAEARAALVDREAADADLAALVHGMLAADAEERSGTPLVDVVRSAAAASAEAAAHHLTPLDRLGPYRVVKMLGEGGMGAVYLAERDDDEFLQRVAIKIVRGRLNPERIRQFRSERQILAWLEHPNIARLLDGGTTEDGLPYLVMEQVEGLPIDQHCDERRLAIESRLRLFLEVCDAVSHAHRSLIVHRDIKPGNIMVDDDGVPKLLDFGIARLALDDVPDWDRARAHGRMLTPDYASPEVVRGDQVTTAADVYALGVLLYELLTGVRPLRVSTMTSSDIERVVCHTLPPAASEAAREVIADMPPPLERASRRHTTPELLRRRLRGDLDAITAMALHKDQRRRYASAEALAADVRRHLDHLPVSARPLTQWERAARLCRRHRWAAAAVFVLAGLGAAAAIAQSRQAARMAEQRDATTRERDTAQQMLRFLTELFEMSSAGRTTDGPVTVRQLLDHGAERVETELAGRPAIQAQLLATIGRVYGNIGVNERAAVLLERALTQRRATLGTGHRETIDSMVELAEVFRRLARLDEAESLLREALTSIRQRGLASSLRASALNGLGRTLSDRGQHAEAESVLREAVSTWRTSEGPAALGVATALQNLARTLRRQDRVDEAVPALEQAVAIRRQGRGSWHPAVADALADLGSIHYGRGEVAKAEPLLREAHAIFTRAGGVDHADTVRAADALAALLVDQGNAADAEPLLRQRLARALDASPPAPLAVAGAQYDLGLALMELRRSTEAEPLLRAALTARQRGLPQDHDDVVRSLAALGWAEAVMKRPGADVRQRAAVEAAKTGPTGRDALVADALLALAGGRLAAGAAALAEAPARDVLAIRTTLFHEGHWKRAQAQATLGRVLRDLGRRTEARPLLESAATALASRLGESAPRTVAGRALLYQDK